MATIGQTLSAPEAGWNRFGSTDPKFLYEGTWSTVVDGGYYNGSQQGTLELNAKIVFRFMGTKIRIITDANPGSHSSDVQIKIDGEVSHISLDEAHNYQRLSFEKVDLSLQMHSVEITNLTNKSLGFSGIDIESTGSLELPVDTPVQTGLLRVTMIDSSEREYRLSTSEIDGFVNWYTRTIGTGISCYTLNDIVDNSKEYLSFEKIISFKVIPLKD